MPSPPVIHHRTKTSATPDQEKKAGRNASRAARWISSSVPPVTYERAVAGDCLAGAAPGLAGSYTSCVIGLSMRSHSFWCGAASFRENEESETAGTAGTF